MPPEPTPPHEPRSARWQGEPAGAFSAGSLRSPCQHEGAEGLRSRSAPGGVLWSLGAPGGRRARWPRAQGAQAVRFLRLKPEHGDGAGWAGVRFPRRAPAAASGSRAGFAAEARGGRPSLRGALPSGGVCGGSAPA
jgi:hypothetical protein